MRRQPEALNRQRFDVVLLGGGITGAGIALDAVLRGLRVALIEKGDFASGTSSISSKLIHGGIRYLEQGQFGLVYEALAERRRLLHNAPHLVWPLRFLIPFTNHSRIPSWKYRAGLLLYDLLAGRDNLQPSRGRSLRWIVETHPQLKHEQLLGGAEYSDAQMDDARLCLAVLATAAERGAIVCNYVEAEHVEGQTIHAVDHLTNQSLRLYGEVIVNATGPWSDRVRQRAGEQGSTQLAPTKGVHLILPDRGLSYAYLLLHPRDGRVFFVIPWLGKTLLGTTDTDCTDSPDELIVTKEDRDYLLEGFNHHFRVGANENEILGSTVGVRPLIRARPGAPSSRSREWKLVEGPTGMLSVLGGKYTTYRAMAQSIVDRVMRRLGRWKPCRTRIYRLLGTPSGVWADFEQQAIHRASSLVPVDTARHLVRRYGQRVGELLCLLHRNPELAQRIVDSEPDIRAEVVFQREQEMACRVEDFILRRTRLGLFQPRLLQTLPQTLVSSLEFPCVPTSASDDLAR